MARKTNIDELINQKHKLILVDAKIFRENLGDGSLVSQKNKLKEILLHVDKAIENAEGLSDETISQVRASVTEITNFINEVGNLSDGDFVSRKANLEIRIEDFFDKHLKWWSQVLIIVTSKFDLTQQEKIISELKQQIEHYKTQGENLNQTISELKSKTGLDADEIEKLKKSLEIDLHNFETRYKDQFTKSEILSQELSFSDESTKNYRTSILWLAAVIISIISIFSIFAYLKDENWTIDIIRLLEENKIDNSKYPYVVPYEMFKSAILRILLITLGIYSLTFSIKNYNAAKHNQTINKHKSNSLAAALALLTRAKTSDGNDELMNQAARAIFSHQKTGFIGKDNEPNNPMISEKIIEKLVDKT